MGKFRTVDELATYLEGKIQKALSDVEQTAIFIFDDVMAKYYAEFTPSMYERTYQLMYSVTWTGVQKIGNVYQFSVYFDLNKLNYLTGHQPTGEQVFEAAKQGMHGAIGSYLGTHGSSSGQYEFHSGEFHYEYGTTKVWEETLEKVRTVLLPELRKRFQAAGFIIM